MIKQTHRSILRVFPISLIVVLSVNVFSQNTAHPSFQQFTSDQGLASSEVYHILQDNQGYLWISTDNGVSRFDGYSFQNYGVKEGLLENVIFRMQLDSLGRVWMQAMSGNLYYFDGKTIQTYRHNEVLLNFKNRLDISKGFIVEGDGKTVHIATFKYGIITIFENGKTKTYPQKEPFYWQIFEKNKTLLTAFTEQGNTTTSQSFIKNLSRQKHNPPIYFQSNEKKYSLNQLIHSKKEGQPTEAFRLSEEDYLLKIYHDVWYIKNDEILWQIQFPYHIDHAAILESGQLCLGLYDQKGLWVYDSLEAFKNGKGQPWLQNQSVSFFLEDKEGGMWVATNEDGLFYAPPGKFRVYDLSTGLPDEKVTALTIKNDHELYVGFRNGAIWNLNTHSGNLKALPDIPTRSFLRDLHFDNRNNQLWAGRINLYAFENEKWNWVGESENGNRFSIGNRITQNPNGNRLWVSNHFGFMSIELPEKMANNIHRGTDQRTYVVLEDFDGKIWVGQPKGLFEWRNDSLYECQYLHPAFSSRVEDLALLPDSTLVTASKGGGLIFWKENQFKQITTEQGLTADMLECLWAGDDGTLWAGTLNGLNQITDIWENPQVNQITVSHGLPSNEINQIRTFGENIWVGTSKGLVHFSNKKTSHFAPKPIINNLSANNFSLDLSQPISLKSNQNNLTIHFFAINFKMKGKIPYRYRINGDEWTIVSNRTLHFPALPSGNRFFEVQAQNEDGIWSESAELQFEIHPPWWATWWAKILGFAFIGFTGLTVFKFRTRQIKKAHQIQLKISELERSALQAQMNPHFIFNCLNSIQNYILQNEQKEAILYLGSFASLVRSMLKASVTGNIQLVEEIDLLNHYLTLEKMRFKNRFEYKIKTAEGLDTFGIKIPPLLVQPYIENAVLHGISRRENRGEIEIFFELKNNDLEVSITDNGKGFSEKKEKKNTGNHESFGMTITQNRLEILSNQKEQNPVHIETLKDGKSQILGTKVTIKIGLLSKKTKNKHL